MSKYIARSWEVRFWFKGDLIFTYFYCDVQVLVIMSTRFVHYLTHEKQEELKRIANAISAPGKGILAADESTGIVLILRENISVLKFC